MRNTELILDCNKKWKLEVILPLDYRKAGILFTDIVHIFIFVVQRYFQ